MATARDVIELFLTADEARARELAGQLDTLNRERQQTEAEIIEAILARCEEDAVVLRDSAALVFAGPEWHLGVLGIVASRLVERFSRPVFVLSQAAEDGHFSGSGRSIPAFHLLDALESMRELFTKFGGHRQAAGLTLRASHVETFRQRFHTHAAGVLTSDDLRPLYRIDAETSFSALSERCIAELQSLGPFGFGNPSPIFLCSGAEVAGPPKALKEGKHFNVPLRHNGRLLFAKAWNFEDRAGLLQPGTKLDVLFQVEDDPYSRKRGYGSWCVTLKDVRPSTS
jgi:single-stranded-DNA-specific exonuclease